MCMPIRWINSIWHCAGGKYLDVDEDEDENEDESNPTQLCADKQLLLLANAWIMLSQYI